MSTDLDRPDPSLTNVLVSKSLRWVFVGGKGGVGKTTTSCALACQLASVRRSVLLISTDPAHNLSDAFRQKFTRSPTAVQGVDNLFAMEVDPTPDQEELEQIAGGIGGGGGSESGSAASFLGDLASSIPGIDEAMSFAEVMRQVQSLDYETIVFDTAPTGHTLRLLQFPTTLQKGLDKLMSFKSAIGGAMATMGPLLGAPADMQDALIGKLDELKSVVDEVNSQFRNPELTTFVCVCIPEFLSLYETERLVQELAKFEIDCRNVVVNQVISPAEVGSSRLLAARVRMQESYLKQFDDLYEDFHLVKMPLLDEEVRGVEALKAFSRFLVDPAAAEEAGRRGTLLPEGEGDGKSASSSSSSSSALEQEVAALRKRVAELEKELAEAKKK